MQKTYRFKIKDPNPGKIAVLRYLAAGPWRKELNFAVEMAKGHRPGTAYDLHPFIYTDLRLFGLSSQLACACRDRAFEAYQSHQELQKSDPGRHWFPHFDGVTAIRLNIPRSCRLFERPGQHWIEVSTPEGCIALRVAGRIEALERVWRSKPTHAEIVFKRDEVFFHVGVAVCLPKVSPKDRRTFIGIDFNVLNHLIVARATDAAGRALGCFFFPAGRFNWKRKHFAVSRRELQQAGAHCKLKGIRKREQNFVDAFLHQATTSLVRWGRHFPRPFLAIEDLSGIRANVKASRNWNRKLHSWPFRSGQAMLQYKGLSEGFFVKQLRGAFSSRYCSRCGGRNTRRSGASFACLECGYGLNVHLNGAANMAWRAVRYTLAAAGRAGDKTAERQSGPYAGDRDATLAAQSSLGGHLDYVFCKPLTSVRGS